MIQRRSTWIAPCGLPETGSRQTLLQARGACSRVKTQNLSRQQKQAPAEILSRQVKKVQSGVRYDQNIFLSTPMQKACSTEAQKTKKV
ncbi:hypothetical protein V6N12_010677 [Hibiscus sabdariffa]|uniref:Uncharacterized protein n=1 Tax=Hibiscus sabdariffa TaxID=183260 RepID=A0ABR2EKS6_9ROSI